MNLNIEQLQVLNDLLPPGYLLEPVKPVLRDSSQSVSYRLFDLSPFSDTKAVPAQSFDASSGRPSRSQVTEGYHKLFTLLAKLKKHPGSVYFQGSEKEGRDKQEINLAMVEGRLFREEYESGWQCGADLRRMCADRLVKSAGDSQTATAVAAFRSYFEGLITSCEDVILTMRKLQKVDGTEGPTSGFPEEHRRLLILKIRILDEKYIRGIAETLQIANIEEFLDHLEERIGALNPMALKGLALHVEACLAKTKSLPGPQLASAEIQQGVQARGNAEVDPRISTRQN